MIGMMIDIGPKFKPSPHPTWPQVQGHRPRIFMLKFYVKVLRTSLFPSPLMDFVHVWYDNRYWSKNFVETFYAIPSPLPFLTSRSNPWTFEFSCESFTIKFLEPHYFQALWWILSMFGMIIDIGQKNLSKHFMQYHHHPSSWPQGQIHGLEFSC